MNSKTVNLLLILAEIRIVYLRRIPVIELLVLSSIRINNMREKNVRSSSSEYFITQFNDADILSTT